MTKDDQDFLDLIQEYGQAMLQAGNECRNPGWEANSPALDRARRLLSSIRVQLQSREDG